MDIYELWRARVEGRFGLKHYLYAWLISTRIFAIPWAALFTVFGTLMAGVSSIERAIVAPLIVSFTLLAAHFNNNYKDVERGVDKYVDSPEEAKRICSTIKPYTAAAWIVPLRITSIRFQMANEILFIVMTIVTYLYFYSRDITILIATLPIALLGLTLARTYTTVFKPHRLGEIAIFLGHGFGATAFGFLSQKPDIVTATLVAIPPGLISAMFYSVDQFLDIKTDFVERVRSTYESWFNSKMPLGLYVILSFAFWINVVVAWVAAGIYPKGTLQVLALIPAILFIAPQIDYDTERALSRLVIIILYGIPLMLCIGAII